MWSQFRHDPFSILCRKKPIDRNNGESSRLLRRCLTFVDLLLLEIGCMIGAGIFIVVGSSIRDKAGSGVLLSYLIAGVPSFIAALCYAEFGARIPKAGSTYDFVYATLGEFWAALIGWYYVSSGVFWAAAGALAWSSYFDSLLGNWIRNTTMESIPWFDSPYLAPYPDFFACFIILVFCAVVATGAKNSALINNFFSTVKLLVIAFIIVYGFTFADLGNWTDPGRGGFLPYGFSGVVSAAPDCFLSFVGFDAATMAGEEARDATRNVALAIATAFGVVVAAYVLMCASLTLMLPYDLISATSSFADAFSALGSPWAQYVVAAGALSALTTVLFGTVFSFPRYAYSVASDGLVFRFLGRVNKRTGVPVLAICLYASLAVLVTLMLDLKALIEFLSLGSLLCYTFVPACVIIVRYNGGVVLLKDRYRWTRLDRLPAVSVANLMVLQVVLITSAAALIARADWWTDPAQFYPLAVLLALMVLLLVALQFVIAAFQPNEHPDQACWFKVPLVPVLPSISMFINILMILYLTPITWLRFAIYMCLGLVLYLVYGIRHSAHRIKPFETAAVDGEKAAEHQANELL